MRLGGIYQHEQDSSGKLVAAGRLSKGKLQRYTCVLVCQDGEDFEGVRHMAIPLHFDLCGGRR
jgi:hypothetical protein